MKKTMDDEDIFSLNMFGELKPVPDYTELPTEDTTDIGPEEVFERWCGGKGGYDNWIERMDD